MATRRPVGHPTGLEQTMDSVANCENQSVFKLDKLLRDVENGRREMDMYSVAIIASVATTLHRNLRELEQAGAKIKVIRMSD